MKISGKEGRVNYGSEIVITNAEHVDGVVTVDAAAHGFVVGDRARINEVVGMTDLNASFSIESIPSDNSFTVNLTTDQTYDSGGVVKKTIEIVSWEMNEEGGEADVSDSSTDDDAEYIPAGKIRRSGSLEGFLYAGQNYPELNALIDIEFVASSTLKYSAQAFLTSNKIGPVNVPGGDGVKVAYNFRLTGALTKTDITNA